MRVYELPPAHTLCWKNGRVTLQRYAAPRLVQRGRSLRSWAQAIGDALADSAAAHRIADVEVGCFLSGGWIPRWSCGRRRATSLRYSVFRSAIGRKKIFRAARRPRGCGGAGRALTETTVTAEAFFDANRAIQWYLDEPMPNPAEVPLYFLCKTARQRVKSSAVRRGGR